MNSVNHNFFENVGTWVQRYLAMCDHIAKWSKDPSSKFGCVITDTLNRPLANGFNGFARGFEDTPERWNDRKFKYAHVLHSEENAIFNATTSLMGSIAYVCGCPCSSCMSKFAQVGVATVWAWEPTEDYLSRWSVEHPITVAKECGISVNFVSRPKK